MNWKKRITAVVLTLAVCLTLILPIPTRAAGITFTVINERVLPLTDETMPVWGLNNVYVPYTTFDADENGMLWGIECSYSKSSGVVTVYDLERRLFLEFDIREGISRDGLTGEEMELGAALRGSTPYLPVSVVCNFFGMSYTYRDIDQGSLLRIKTDEVVLSDNRFLDAATNVLETRLRDYNKKNQPEEKPPVEQQPPAAQPEENEQDVTTYLALRCDRDEYLPAILALLEHHRVKVMLFVTPELVRERGDLVMWMLGAGHSVGLLAQGEDLDQTRYLLDVGSRELEEQVFMRAAAAMVEKDQIETLEQEGWTCWNPTLDLTPGDGDGPSYFARRVIGRLPERGRAVYLSLDVGENTLRVLPTLLRELEDKQYHLALPLETRL